MADDEIQPDHREYVRAEWHVKDGSHPSPKVAGGYTTDQFGRIIPNRAMNRPDQRYTLPEAEIRSRRAARALAEKAGTLALRTYSGLIQVLTPVDNRYDVDTVGLKCSCPDWERLQLSYPGANVSCKHILVAAMWEADVAPALLPVTTLYLAQQIGIDDRTVQHHCQLGDCAATKIRRTWVIQPDDADDFIALYRSRIVGSRGG